MNTSITNNRVRIADLLSSQAAPRTATGRRPSPITTATRLVALLALLAIAGPASADAADAAKTAAKKDPPSIPVNVVGGNVQVTGVVEISNTALPVVVQNDITMQGTVEVLNDVLYQPFVVTQDGFLGENDQNGRVVTFDIPDGKRLIIESVSVQLTTPVGQTAMLYLLLEQTNNSHRSFPFVPTVPQVVLGTNEYHVGCHAFKMRKDAIAGSNDEILVYMTRSHYTGLAQAQVGVCGYLVDL